MEASVWFAVAAFVGGWLLFAGPVYQASVELREQDGLRAGVAEAVGSVDVPRRVSSWWWLLPPVAMVLQRRRTREFQAVLFRVLTTTQIRQWVQLTEKATGWWLVAAGAFLIAVHETSRLVGEMHAPWWVVGPVVACCGAGGVVFTVLRLRRTRKLLIVAGVHPADVR